MDFGFSEEQALLKDSVERFIRDEYDFATRTAIVRSDLGYRPDFWSRFAELGWLALPFAEDDGGIGGTPVETMILMEAFGQGLVVEPYLASIVLAGGVLRLTASVEQRRALVPGIVEGRTIAALAHSERGARYNSAHVATTANRDGDGFRLNGAKSMVLGGAAADHFVVCARTAGEIGDDGGLSLFWVNASSSGLTRRRYTAIDGSRVCDLSFADVSLDGGALIGAPGGALPVLETVFDQAITALCAEAVGAMSAAMAYTLEYTKTRKQFGAEIGKFQVIQHRMADLHMACEQARSMAYMATLKLDNSDPGERTRAISAAKVQIGRAGRFVGQQAIQLHGGMGMTDELNIGAYFKRLTMIDALFGNAAHHLRRFETLDRKAF
ncbi:MAG: acyl-CoA dehydrogenase family protein [Sphingomonadales bacterium]